MEKFILILFCSLLLFGCKKHSQTTDEPVPEPVPESAAKYDTVKPGSYFPAYPGSYWKYIENNTLTVTYSTSPTWILDSFKISGFGPAPYQYSTPKYISTLWDGTSITAIYGYSKPMYWNNAYGNYYTLCSFLAETPGSWSGGCFVCDARYPLPCSKSYDQTIGKIVKAGMDSILITKGGKLVSLNGSQYTYLDTSLLTYKEYTRGIGLTRKFIINTTSHDTTYRLQMQEYKIGNH